MKTIRLRVLAAMLALVCCVCFLTVSCSQILKTPPLDQVPMTEETVPSISTEFEAEEITLSSSLAETEAETLGEETSGEGIASDNVPGIFLWLPSESMEYAPALDFLEDPRVYGFYTSMEWVHEKSLINHQKSSFLGTVIYDYSELTLKSVTPGEYGDFYCAQDYYKNEVGSEIAFRHGTDFMTYFYRDPTKGSGTDLPPLTEERMVKIANDFLSEILPAETLDHFTLNGCQIQEQMPGVVTYFRLIYGYKTDEGILVMIDETTQEVIGYNGKYVEKYDDIEDTLSEEILNSTKARLEAKLASMDLLRMEIKEYTLSTNTSGEVYMSVHFCYDMQFNDASYTLTQSDTIMTKVEIP